MLERVLGWLQNYGWSIPILGLGVLFGLSLTISLENPADWLSIATALGTLSAAFAAFWSVNHSRHVQKLRNEIEDAARMPFLQILLENTQLFETPDQQPTYRFHFANMSQGSILLRQTVVFDSQPHYWGPEYPDRQGPFIPDVLNFIIGPGEVKEKVINILEIQRLGRTNLYFYFHHSVTGSLLYRLELPVDVSLDDETGQRVVHFSIYEQQIEGPVPKPFDTAGIKLGMPEVRWE